MMKVRHGAVLLVGLIAIAGLIALGTWQVHRRAWKLDLIAQVETRLKAVPVPAPAIAGKADEYRRVAATGRYLTGRDALVQASTVKGPGWWVMTPLVTGPTIGRGVVLVNRGYVATRHAPTPPQGEVTVTGLIRPTEPGGGFLRYNDPAGDRWYSRDVAAIARRDRVAVRPYFIDADAGPATTAPVGGLTFVRFTNNHLVYALTWFALAVMVAGAAAMLLRPARRPA
mgnify:CR=1 FL=1